MDQQFNRHYGAQRRLLTVGQKLVYMAYRSKHSIWIAARVVPNLGNVVYEVAVS